MSNAPYRITFKSSAAKELRKLDKQTQKRILTAIDALALEPRPSGVKKLRAEFDQYRIRVVWVAKLALYAGSCALSEQF